MSRVSDIHKRTNVLLSLLRNTEQRSLIKSRAERESVCIASTYFDNRQPWASPACWRNSRWRWSTGRHRDYGNPRRTPRCNCPSALRHRAAISGCSPWCPCRKSQGPVAPPCSASGYGCRSSPRCTCSCRWTARTSACRPSQRLGVPRRPPRHIVS